MAIDLEPSGWAVLIGLVAQVIVGWSRQHWAWLIGFVAAFAGGFLTSEGLFATATQATNQPNIGGLSFDEALFGAILVAAAAAVVTRLASRQSRVPRPIGT
jgi:hypothetical protein